MITEQDKHRQFDLVATFATLGVLSCWAVGPIFIKYLASYIDAWTQNLLRYGVACLFWLPLILYSVKTKKLDKRVWHRALLPLAPNLIMQTLWAGAFYYIAPAFLVLLTKTSIIWIAGLSLIFFRQERPLAKSKRFWLGLALSISGVVGVLYFKEDFSAKGTITGIVMALLTALFWGLYTIAAKIAFRDIDSRQGFGIVSIYTTAGLFILALIFGNVTECAQMAVGQWMAVILSGITAIALGHALYYTAIKRIGATIPMLVILSQPFFVFTISRFIFGEQMNGLQLISGVALLAGSATAIWAQQHLKTKP